MAQGNRVGVAQSEQNAADPGGSNPRAIKKREKTPVKSSPYGVGNDFDALLFLVLMSCITLVGMAKSTPLNDDELLNSEDLARMLRRSVASIWTESSRAPERLPPRVQVPNTRKLYWRKSTVLAWLREHETQPLKKDDSKA